MATATLIQTDPGPWDVATLPGGDIICANRFAGTVARLGSVQWTTAISMHPVALAVDGAHVTVVRQWAGSASVLSVADGSLVRETASTFLASAAAAIGSHTFSSGIAGAIVRGDGAACAAGIQPTCLRARSGLVYAAGPGALAVMDAETMTVVRTIATSGGPGLVDVADDGTAYVADNYAGTVTVVSASDVRSFDVGRGPWGVAVAGDLLVVTHPSEHLVTVVDAATGVRVAEHAVEGYPWAVATRNRRAWITLAHRAAVAVIDL